MLLQDRLGGIIHMTITIKRNTGWQGSGSDIQIKVNGEETASIAENQHLEVELPNDKANLKVSQIGIKSNEIEVKDGDIVEIISTMWYRLNLPLFIIVMALSILFPGLYRLIAIFSLCSLLVISLFLVDGFYLKVLRKKK